MAAAAALAKSAELDKQLAALRAKNATGVHTNIKGKTGNLPKGGESLAEKIKRLQGVNTRTFKAKLGELPEGWKEADDPATGKKYYFKGTEVKWNRPTEGGKYRRRTRKNKTNKRNRTNKR